MRALSQRDDRTQAGVLSPGTYTVSPSGAVWTKDIPKAHRLAKAMRAGTVRINCYNVFDAALPLVGINSPVGVARWAGKFSRTTPR